MSGKKISNFRGLGKKIGAQTKWPMLPSLQKSNWQPHKVWGRSRRIWHLSRYHLSTNSWCAFFMWWFSRLTKSFAFQEWKYVDKRHKWKGEVQKSAQIHFCGQTRAFRYDIVFRGIQPYLFSSQRIRVLGLFWTKRGSEVSEETWGSFCLQFIFSLKKWAYLKYERVLCHCNNRLVGFSSPSPFFF